MLIILEYHRINNYIDDDYMNTCVSVDNFKNHIDYISNHYKVIRLNEINSVDIFRNEEKYVVLTFDDGYEDIYNNAAPILKERKAPATFFISTKCVDSEENSWMDRLQKAIFCPANFNNQISISTSSVNGIWKSANMKDRLKLYRTVKKMSSLLVENEWYELVESIEKWYGISENNKRRMILSKEQIGELANNSLFEIGAHTHNHLFLAERTIEEQKKEIFSSKNILESIINRPVTSFSYPFGSYDSKVIEILKGYGFDRAVTSFNKVSEDKINIYELPRISVPNYGLDEFKQFIDNAFRIENNYDIFISDKYVGYLNDDPVLLNTQIPLIIWGCGKMGTQLYKELQNREVDNRVIGWGDKNRLGEGSYLGKPILDYEDIESFPDAVILITGSYDVEIYNMLKTRVKNKLHIVFVEE